MKEDIQMSRSGWGSAAGLLLAIAVAAAQATVGHPGTVNFIDGQVALEGKALTPGALEGVEVGAGQTLSTEQGKAEVLLTPGAFLRLGDQTAIKMSSQSASNTSVEVLYGEAILEVVQPVTSRLEVVDGQARANIQRPGIYEFHAGHPAVAVVAGKARRSLAGDALYAWSEQRSRTDAVASSDTAQALVGTDPANWHGVGWYWNPFYATWAYLPATYTISGPFGEKYFSARFYWVYAASNNHSHGYFTAAQ